MMPYNLATEYQVKVMCKYVNHVNKVEFLLVSSRFNLAHVLLTPHDVPNKRDLLKVWRLRYQLC